MQQNRRYAGKKSLVMQAKILVDLLMVTNLFLLMPYALIGEKAHELLGVCMLFLFMTHNLLNYRWYMGLRKGRYSLARWLSTAINLLLLFVMAAMPITGIMMAKHILPSLHLRAGTSTARIIHLMLSHWGYVFAGLHLGFHWNMVVGLLGKSVQSSIWKQWALWILAMVVAAYGVYAFVIRGFGSYMLLINRFAFFDYGEPLHRFYFDYLAIMALFVCLGYYTLKLCRQKRQNSK